MTEATREAKQFALDELDEEGSVGRLIAIKSCSRYTGVHFMQILADRMLTLLQHLIKYKGSQCHQYNASPPSPKARESKMLVS